MKKRLLFSLFLFFAIFCIFFNTATCAELKEINLSQAVKLALENNIDLKIANLNLENAQINYQKNEAANLFTNSNYLGLQIDLRLAQAEDNCSQTRNQIIINVVQHHLQLNQVKRDILIKEKQAKLEKKYLEEIKDQTETGNKGSLDLLKQENRYDNAVFNLERVNDDYRQYLGEFKIELGLNQGEEYNFLEVESPGIWQIKEEEVLSETLKNSFSLKARKRQIEIEEVDLERAQVAGVPELDLKKIKNDKELANLNYEKIEKELSSLAMKQYYSFRQAIKSLDLYQQNLVQAQENNDIVVEQVKADLGTETEFLSAEINLLQAGYNYYSAITNYYLNKLALQQLMGEKIEVVILNE